MSNKALDTNKVLSAIDEGFNALNNRGHPGLDQLKTHYFNRGKRQLADYLIEQIESGQLDLEDSEPMECLKFEPSLLEQPVEDAEEEEC